MLPLLNFAAHPQDGSLVRWSERARRRVNIGRGGWTVEKLRVMNYPSSGSKRFIIYSSAASLGRRQCGGYAAGRLHNQLASRGPVKTWTTLAHLQQFQHFP